MLSRCPASVIPEPVLTDETGGSRVRIATIALALVVLIALLGACGSGGSSAKDAQQDRRSATALKAIKAANARKRAAAAYRRAAAARRRAARTKSIDTTPTTIDRRVRTTRADDLSAIRSTVDTLNAAFRAGVASGITSSTNANYWVANGPYTRDRCVSFEWARGGGIVSEQIVVHTNSLAPATGWVDPLIGTVPRGRTYQVAIDEIQTLVTTGQQRARSLPIHVTVGPDGRARLFLRCH